MQKDIQHWLKCILTVPVQGIVSEEDGHALRTAKNQFSEPSIIRAIYSQEHSDNNVNSCSGRKTAVLIG